MLELLYAATLPPNLFVVMGSCGVVGGIVAAYPRRNDLLGLTHDQACSW